MNNLVIDLFIKHVQSFIKNVSENYDISQDRLAFEWNVLHKHIYVTPKPHRCIHKMRVGVNIGKLCGAKISCESDEYCNKHLPKQKGSKGSRDGSPKKFILKQSIHNKEFYIDPDSNLLFNKEKQVIGKEDIEGKITTLDDHDILYCKKIGFEIKKEI